MREVLTFSNSSEAIRALTLRLCEQIAKRKFERFRLALSGGETAKLMFDMWREDFSKSADWACVDFFWVDERLVDLNSDTSNFKWAQEKFFEPLGISKSQIFNPNPQADFGREAVRLGKLLIEGRAQNSNILDCAILGIGSDGHTASIFPNNPRIFESAALCEIVRKPGDEFMRFTLTPRALKDTGELMFLALGEGKRQVLAEFFKESDSPSQELVAARVFAAAKEAVLFTDVKV